MLGPWTEAVINASIDLPLFGLVSDSRLHSGPSGLQGISKGRTQVKNFQLSVCQLLQVPFIAHKQLGDSYKWLLYGDDDTVWFMDGVLRFLEDLDPDMPYFISGWQASRSTIVDAQTLCPSNPKPMSNTSHIPELAAIHFNTTHEM